MNKTDAHVIVLDMLNWSCEEKITVAVCVDWCLRKLEIVLEGIRE